MNKIASFTVDHRFLEAGVYVSQKHEYNSNVITTIDIRITTPYKEPVLSTGIIHTIEHIGATYMRNLSIIANNVLYFGPMGCRTGFYLVIFGNYSSEDIVPIVSSMFEYIRDFSGPIPGATIKECGNYTDMDLVGAKTIASRFIDNTLKVLDSNHLYYQVHIQD